MKVHLIAICGTGMGSLAGLLKAAGHDVRGSDEHVYPPMSTQLREQGIEIMEGFAPGNLDWGPDRVVVGNVCRRDHVEAVAAAERSLPLTSFPALLEELFLADAAPQRRRAIVVAGTHGKTTTSSLLAHVLTDAGRDPSFLIGGVPLNFSRGFRLGAGPDMVLEGDEYDTAFFDKKSKFLHYRPHTAILTSVELDHVDIFADYAAVEAAFIEFVRLIPADGNLVVAASSPGALAVARHARCQIHTYGRAGTAAAAEWVGTAGDLVGGRARFTITRAGQPVLEGDSLLLGEHNLENLTGVCATATALGLQPPEIARALRRFAGVRRRQDVRGVAQGVAVIDDFAHHPTAVRETLAALRRQYGRGKLLAIYEPRSATARRAVFQHDFADAFAGADEVVVAQLHDPSRIPEAERFDPELLAADLRGRGIPAKVAPDVAAIVDHIEARVQPGDAVVVMSSGAFGGLIDKLLDKLGDAVSPSEPAELGATKALLDRVGLPHPQLEKRFDDYLLLRDEGKVVGCVALELYDESAVLRSLAVSPDRRGQGLGWLLADAAIARARQRGVRRVYLLTESASDFFAEKLGFKQVERAQVDDLALTSPEFQFARKRDAVCMRLDLK
ncbi:MAG: GNAT family N-acetyltransferase [Deltaproteobacteria bacterium]|nr:GNAT family N-acetyltransferase [Deltaproteobacteria bacterium]